MKNIAFDSITVIESPLGPIVLKSLGQAVVKVDMLGFAGDAASVEIDPAKAKVSPVLRDAAKQLDQFFAGKRHQLDFAVAFEGTAFQEAVWHEIAKLGFGEAITYGELAKRIGNPAAVRAVGGAVGSNPVPLVIGCHRILGSGDKITGYSGGDGLPTKRWLLAHERINYRDQASAQN